jgi:hypothetical protein
VPEMKTTCVGGEEIDWLDEPETEGDAQSRLREKRQEMRDKYNRLLASRRDEWSIEEVSELLACMRNFRNSAHASIQKFHKSTPKGSAAESDLRWYHRITKAHKFYEEATKRTHKILNLMQEDVRQSEARERKKVDRERVVIRRMLRIIKERGLLSEEVLNALRDEVILDLQKNSRI